MQFIHSYTTVCITVQAVQLLDTANYGAKCNRLFQEVSIIFINMASFSVG